jgi:hypothetical protein
MPANSYTTLDEPSGTGTPPTPASIASVTDNVAPVIGPLANGAYTSDPVPTLQVT